MSDNSPAGGTTATPDQVAFDSVDEIAQAWRRERPATPVTSIGILTRVRRLAKLLEDDRRRTLARLGIDAATLDLLSTLRRAGSPYQVSPSQLAQRTLVSAGAISQRVARAERTGLVRRVRPGPDGRAVLVTLTEAGHALIERCVDDLLTHEESLLSGLTGQERRQLTDLLRRLLTALSGGQ